MPEATRGKKLKLLLAATIINKVLHEITSNPPEERDQEGYKGPVQRMHSVRQRII